MGLKIIMGVICIIPLSFIMWGVFWFEGKVKGNILFGVTLSKEAIESEEIKNIQRYYKKKLMLVNLIVWAGFILSCIPSRESIVMSAFMLLILIAIFIYFIPFMLANKKVVEYKSSQCKTQTEEVQKTQKIAVDMTAAAMKEPVEFVKAGGLGMILGIIPFILELIFKRSDDMWGINLLIIGVFSLVGIVFLVMMFYFRRMKTDVFSKKSAVNIQMARAKRYQWCRALAVMIWVNTVYAFYMWIRMGDGFVSSTEIVVVSLVYTAALVAVMLTAQIKTIGIQNKYATELLEDSDDDKYWIFGMIYYNKNDRRFMVNNRSGMGTTVNMAKTSAKIFMGVIFLSLVVMLTGSAVWMIMLDFTPVKLCVRDDIIISEQLGKEYEIQIDSIESVQLLEQLPDLSKRVGTGMETLYKGSFVDKNGEKSQVCVRIKDGPYIKIAADGNVYYLNDESADFTIAVYKYLCEKTKQ